MKNDLFSDLSRDGKKCLEMPGDTVLLALVYGKTDGLTGQGYLNSNKLSILTETSGINHKNDLYAQFCNHLAHVTYSIGASQ